MKKYIAMIAALAVVLLGLVAAPASAVEGYSQDPENPTLVETVPQGFGAFGDPSVTEDNCITTTVQNYSRTTVIDDEKQVRERSWIPATFTDFERKRTATYTPGKDVDYTHEWQKQVRSDTYKYKVGKFYNENVYDYTRYSYNKKHDNDPRDNNSTPHTDPDHWQKNNKGYDGSPVEQYIHEGGGNGSWFWWVAELEHAAGEQYTSVGTIYVTDLNAPFTWGGHTYSHVGDTRVVDGIEFITKQVGDPIPTGYTNWVNDGGPVKQDTAPGPVAPQTEGTVQWIDLGGQFIETPATEGSWSWAGPWSAADNADWTPAEPLLSDTTTFPVLSGAGTQEDKTFTQTRSEQNADTGVWGPWSFDPESNLDGWAYVEQTETYEKQKRVSEPGETFTEYVYTSVTTGEECPPEEPTDPEIVVHDNLVGPTPDPLTEQPEIVAPQVVKPTGAVLPNTGASDMLVPTLIGTVLLGLGLVALRRFSR